MSEFFSGITFPWQKVTPSDDASVRRSVLADGILSGCKISYIGSTLTMGAGLLIGCGRQFRHTAVQNFAVTGASSGYARLVITIDTTKASTKDAFDQISTSIEYATALDGFTQLRQDDINEAGTVYQMQICVVSLGAGGISGIVLQLGNTKLSMELLWENASPTSEFAAQEISIDLSPYKFVRIFYLQSSADSTPTIYASMDYFVGVPYLQRLIVPGVSSGSQSYRRDVLIAGTTKIKFENGIHMNPNATTLNTVLPPYQIYGIKGVSA